VYPNILSAIRPIPNTDDENLPIPTSNTLSEDNSTENSINENAEDAKEFKLDEVDDFKGINQAQLDHFVRKLKLSKDDACLAALMLKDFGALHSETKVSVYRRRDVIYENYFSKNEESGLVYCCDIPGLLNELGMHGNICSDWWLFIDGSIQILKAVLLHIDDKYPSIPVAYD